jgi:hydrogenase-4 component F
VNNAMTKGVLFLSAGNIHRAYRSKSTAEVHGALSTVPLSSALLIAGFLAGCGSPPFGPFVSEFTIVAAAFAEQHYVLAAIFLTLMMIIFVGMGSTVMSIVFGKPSKPDIAFPDGLLTGAPILIFMALAIMLGIYIPQPLRELVNDAAQFLQDVRPPHVP